MTAEPEPASGIEFVVHVRPGGRVDRIEGDHGGALAVRVRAAAEDGKTNRAVEALLAQAFDVALRCVVIVAGRQSRRKRVRIEGDGQQLSAVHALLMRTD